MWPPCYLRPSPAAVYLHLSGSPSVPSALCLSAQHPLPSLLLHAYRSKKRCLATGECSIMNRFSATQGISRIKENFKKCLIIVKIVSLPLSCETAIKLFESTPGVSVFGIATCKHKNPALSPLLTACFLVASESAAKLERLQKSLCMIKKINHLTITVSTCQCVSYCLSSRQQKFIEGWSKTSTRRGIETQRLEKILSGF